MSTINEKLATIKSCKSNIYTAIQNKGGGQTSGGTKLSKFSTDIEKIPSFKTYTTEITNLEIGSIINLSIPLNDAEFTLYYVSNSDYTIDFFFVEAEALKEIETYVCINEYSGNETKYWLGLLNYRDGSEETITIKQQLEIE